MIIKRIPALSLFKTSLFRDSSWIQTLCREVGDVWVTEVELPPGHFGTYFGALGIREYGNAHIGDLYYLHELWHIKTFGYNPKQSTPTWMERIFESELQASLVSECYVYFHIPDLRDQTFAHEIWVDRFLARYHGKPITLVEREIAVERVRAYTTPLPHDFHETQIAHYMGNSHKWWRIWAGNVSQEASPRQPAWRLVEAHMTSDPTQDQHQTWIDSVSTDGMPFAEQGAAFARVYDETKRLFGNELFTS